MPDLTYDDGLNDGYMLGLSRAASLIDQALADGLPHPEVDEPTRGTSNDHDLKPLDENT